MAKPMFHCFWTEEIRSPGKSSPEILQGFWPEELDLADDSAAHQVSSHASKALLHELILMS